MPVSSASRYFGVSIFEAPDSNGDIHATVGMRLSPAAPETTVYQHTVAALESLEYLAWRSYRSSDSWWRIADANPLEFPLDWKPGDAITIPVGAQRGLLQRTRKF